MDKVEIKNDAGEVVSTVKFTTIPTVIKNRYIVSVRLNSLPCDLIECLNKIPNDYVLIMVNDESQSDDGQTTELCYEKEVLQG